MRDLLRRRQPKRDRGASHRSELPAEGSLLHQVIEAALPRERDMVADHRAQIDREILFGRAAVEYQAQPRRPRPVVSEVVHFAAASTPTLVVEGMAGRMLAYGDVCTIARTGEIVRVTGVTYLPDGLTQLDLVRGLGGSVECVQAGDQVLRLSTVGLSAPAAMPATPLRQRISRRVLAARRRVRLALEAWVMSVRSGAWGDGFVTRMAWWLVGAFWGAALWSCL